MARPRPVTPRGPTNRELLELVARLEREREAEVARRARAAKRRRKLRKASQADEAKDLTARLVEALREEVAAAQAKAKATQAGPTEKEQELLERIADLEAAKQAPAEAPPPVVQVRRGITAAELERWTTKYSRSAQFLGMTNVRIEDGMILGTSKDNVEHRGYLVRSISTKEISYCWTPLHMLAGYVSSAEFGDVYENMSADAGTEPFIHFFIQDGDE